MLYDKLVAFKATKEMVEKMEKRAKELKMSVSEYVRYIVRKDIYE